MNRKIIIIIAVVILGLIVLGLGWYWAFGPSITGTPAETASSTGEFFPGGGVRPATPSGGPVGDNPNLGPSATSSAASSTNPALPAVHAGKFTQISAKPSASSTKDKVFSLETAGSGVSGRLADVSGKNSQLLFSSPLNDWRAAWATTTVIALETSPATSYSGALYFLDIKTKKLTAMITGVPGLTALASPHLDYILYSGETGNNLVFGFYNIKSQTFGRLPIQTWADKCVWSASGAAAYCAVPKELPTGFVYPDSWYRGEVDLTDNLWRLEPKSGKAKIIFNPTLANINQPIDAGNLTLNSDESILYLINRHDQTLWELNLQTGS